MRKLGIFATAVALTALAISTPAVGGGVSPGTIGITNEQGNGLQPAVRPSVSGNGKLVVFATQAPLVGSDDNELSDIYLYNRGTDSLRRLTKGLGGDEPDDDSDGPVISNDGKKVAFDSDASNLVPNDTNDSSDVFVLSVGGGPINRVSVSSTEKQAKNGDSYAPSISQTGKVIAFQSYATNLVTGDTNDFGDVFVRYTATGKTKRVSVKSNGNQANGDSELPAVDPKGLMVSFTSYADNLVANDDNEVTDVFLRYDGKTSRVSVTNAEGEANSYSDYSALTSKCMLVGTQSQCAATVVFTSGATNLVTGDDNDAEDVFVRSGGNTKLISMNSDEDQGELFQDSGQASISSNGRYVAFTSEAALGPDANGVTDIYLRNRQAGTTTLISTGPNGPGNGLSEEPAISGDGKWVAFQSMAYNLYQFPMSSNLTMDIFLRGPLF